MLVVCVLMGLLGLAIYQYAEAREEQFRRRTLAYFKSFTLPWFAILGANKALEHDLGIFAAVVIGLIATTAGGVLIDLFSNVTPEVVMPAEHVVTTAVIASLLYTLFALYTTGWLFSYAMPTAALVAFLFRVFAVRDHFPQIVLVDAPPAGRVAGEEKPFLKKVGGSRQ